MCIYLYNNIIKKSKETHIKKFQELRITQENKTTIKYNKEWVYKQN